jgi:hypothetical protein
MEQIDMRSRRFGYFPKTLAWRGKEYNVESVERCWTTASKKTERWIAITSKPVVPRETSLFFRKLRLESGALRFSIEIHPPSDKRWYYAEEQE